MTSKEKIDQKLDPNEELAKLQSFVDALSTEFGFLFGKKFDGNRLRMTPQDVASFWGKMNKLAGLSQELEKIQHMPPSSGNLKNAYVLINKLYRASLPGLPRKVEPVQYLIKAAKNYCAEPVLDFPGVNHSAKHAGMRAFSHEIVNAVDENEVNTFLDEAITGRHVTSQIQRGVRNIFIPNVFKNTLKQSSCRNAENIKTALRDVLCDWEALINLIYGLKLILKGDAKTWAEIHEVALRDKVRLLVKDERLQKLVNLRWITVRNSLNHGTAYFNPADERIEFPDKRQHEFLVLSDALKEGQEVVSANVAMLYCPTLIRAERILSLEPVFKAMKLGRRLNTAKLRSVD
jgi:ribosome-binding factor A